MHMGVRLLRDLERECFLVNPVALHSYLQCRGDGALAEGIRTTDVEVAVCEIGYESSQSPRIETDVKARADDLMELASTVCDERSDFVTMHNVLWGCRTGGVRKGPRWGKGF